MFYIDKVDMRLEDEIKIYSIEMSLQDKCQERIESLHRIFQTMLYFPLLHFLLQVAKFLTAKICTKSFSDRQPIEISSTIVMKVYSVLLTVKMIQKKRSLCTKK